MKKGLVLASLLLPAAPATASDLIITGIMDGPLSRGTPKAVELFARSDIADLSIYGFGSANNGDGSDGQEFALSGDAAAGDFLYIASEATNFNAVFGFAPDFTTTSATVNGDDAVELFRNGMVVDVFGEIDVDGDGQPWEYLDSWAYRQSGTGPDGSAFAIAHWGFGGVDALDDLDAAATAAAVPFGTFAVAPVPVPAAVWLLGSALLGLIGLRSRPRNG
ncbi:MAG: hypothetical protein U5S82_08855 [Gammaproteobacteria bacterium]|nr:hypothetical protein [Gammaproteobacteria bacterium]